LTRPTEALLRRLHIADVDIAPLLETLAAVRARAEWSAAFASAVEEVGSQIGLVDLTAPLTALPDDIGAPQRGRVWTLVFAATADAVHAWHRTIGIPNEVSWATLGDLGRHVAQHRRRNGGVTGLSTEWWLTLHWRGALYELGRLQFNMYPLKTGPGGPLFWYSAEELAAMPAEMQVGAPVLGVHIPTGLQLDPAGCDASFHAAAELFPGCFPDRASRIATCTSWMLDEQLAEYLPAESNIVRFQRRFNMVPGALEPYNEIFNWVFDRIPESVDELAPRTTLEHAVVDHVRSGRRWHLRTGWLRLG
jgi:GNAT-like C-terminal domain/N-acyltransferase N-terminal domain